MRRWLVVFAVLALTNSSTQGHLRGTFQGDMLLTYPQAVAQFGTVIADQLKASNRLLLALDPTDRRLGVASHVAQHTDNLHRWDVRNDGNQTVVPYYYAGDPFSFFEKVNIDNALVELSQALKYVKFVKYLYRPYQFDNYVAVSRDPRETGCFSNVGKYPGFGEPNIIHLAPGCVTKATVQHEALHTLGKLHEHSRTDRDAFVRINHQNIRAGAALNFAKALTTSLGVAYDYQSIMHYHADTFGKTPVTCAHVPDIRCNALATLQSTTSRTCLDVVDDVVKASDCIMKQNSNSHQFWHPKVETGFAGSNATVRFVHGFTVDLCLSANYTATNLPGEQPIPLSVAPCEPGNQNQLFQVHHDDTIRWEWDNQFCLSSSQDTGAFVLDRCDDQGAGIQNWFVGWLAKVEPDVELGCEDYRFECELQETSRATTIDTMGNSLSPDSLSPSDVRQMQLLYKCASPRTEESFCTEDCPCNEGEGSCTSSGECVAGLECDGQQCVRKSTPSPTGSPSVGSYTTASPSTLIPSPSQTTTPSLPPSSATTRGPTTSHQTQQPSWHTLSPTPSTTLSPTPSTTLSPTPSTTLAPTQPTTLPPTLPSTEVEKLAANQTSHTWLVEASTWVPALVVSVFVLICGVITCGCSRLRLKSNQQSSQPTPSCFAM